MRRILLLLALFSCSSKSGVTSGADLSTMDLPAAACTAVTRTCAQIMATFDSGSANVTVSCDDSAGTFTVNASGTPNYASNQTTPNPIKDQKWVVVLPLTPACASSTTSVVASRGAIGFMVNGVPFYGPEDANGNDAVVNEGASFDSCQGHADMFCSYHYHEEPTCVFGQGTSIASHDESDGHPPVIGYALDGFALYGSDTTATLDSCNGHVDATRGYHYHATPKSPYLIGCYMGKDTGTMSRTMPTCP
jgi:hypothetical protein